MAAADPFQGCEPNELERNDFSAAHSKQSARPEPATMIQAPTPGPSPSMCGGPPAKAPAYGSLLSPISYHSGQAQAIGLDKYDSTGQIVLPGMKPRLTGTLWQNEGTFCFQVEAKGVCVARREDNHFINGTKLLNVADMTRGRRDGILKSERTKHLVKAGPTHLRGVWIPYERALDFANKEKITDLLYPLFVHNIGSLLYNPENAPRTNPVVQATEPGPLGTTNLDRAPQLAQSAVDLHHRAGIGRNHIFPTPSTSFQPHRNYEWGGDIPMARLPPVSTVFNTESLYKDFSYRILPRTPCTTPPGSPQRSVQFRHDQERSQQSSLGTGPATSSGLRRQYNASAHDDSNENASFATLSPSKPASPGFFHVTRPRLHPTSTTDRECTDVVHKIPIVPKQNRIRTGCLTCCLRHLKCDETKPICQNCKKSRRECRPRKQRYQEADTRAAASDYKIGSVEAPTFCKPESDTERASPTISIASTEDGIVSRSAVDDRIIAICSRVLVSAYAQCDGTNDPPLTESCGPNDPKTVSEPGGKGQAQGSRSSQPPRKRRRADDGGSADEGKDRGKKFQRTEIEPPKVFERPLACPFNKFDNRLFGPDSPDESYHSCATCNFVNIAHLKQHLRRNHYLPKHYCYRCCRQDFVSDSMVAAHLREEPICVKIEPPRYLERIGPDLIEALSIERKNTPGTAREEYWHRVYNTFFPGAANRRSVTPYYEGPAAEHLEQFLRFSYGVVGDLYAAVQWRADAPAVANHADMISIHHDIIQQAGQQYLQQMISRTLPILGYPRQVREGNITEAAPLGQQFHTGGENFQQPECYGVASGRPSSTTTDQDIATSLTTASDILSPAFPRTPQRLGDTENHRLRSAALVSQAHPLPSQNLETGRGSYTSPAEEVIFDQGDENASLHHLTSNGFGSPLDLDRDLHFDWNTEIDQMLKSNTGEWGLFTTI